MPPDPAPPDPSRPKRRPESYRPDLRPMLIVLGLIAAVTLGWLFLSPLILPPV